MSRLKNSDKMCSHLGCERKVYAKGLCESHWKKSKGFVEVDDVDQNPQIESVNSIEICETGHVLGILKQLSTSIIKKRPRTNIVEWIESEVKLPAGQGEDGGDSVSFRDYPHISEILGYVCNGVTKRINLCCSSQSGKTIMLISICVYLVKEKGWSGMYNLPSDKMISYFPESRIIPSLERSGVKISKYDKKGSIIYFEGGNALRIGLLNSPSTLAESSYRFVIDDEIDEIRNWVPDPIELSDNRLTAYKDAVHLTSSTPKLLDGNGTISRHEKSKRFELMIRCDCGELIDTSFPNAFRWPSNESWFDVEVGHKAEIVCTSCGNIIDDKKHDDVVRHHQEWVDMNPDVPPIEVSFRIKRWNTISKNYSNTVSHYLKVKDDMLKLIDFNNSWCADPKEVYQDDAGEVTDYDKFRGSYSRNNHEIPEEVEYITAGIDCGKRDLWVVLYGWGLGNRVFPFYSCRINIEDESDEEILKAFETLEEITSFNEFKHRGSKDIIFVGGGVDSGYHTSLVYEFCKASGGLWKPMKGDNKRKATLISMGDADPENKHRGKFRGLEIVLHQTHEFQEILHRRLKAKPFGKGSMTFAMDEGVVEGNKEIKGKPRLFKHFDAVVRKTLLVKGCEVVEWQKRRHDSDDHLRDACGIAEAVGRMEGLHEIEDVKEQERQSNNIPTQLPMYGFSKRL